MTVGLHRETIPSVGLFKSPNFPDVDTSSNVRYFRHALALDEKRVRLLPEYVRMPETKPTDEPIPHVKEVWFPGVHSDM